MRLFILLPLTIFFWSCQETAVPSDEANETWTIDTQYLWQGCYDGKDCIPSLTTPERSEIGGSDLSFLDDNDLVIGVWNGSEHIAYPHSILDWHEIINEDGYSISYCPLTGSAIHLSSTGEYGVSGLLYNSNLIMYDRETGSYWPQMLLRSAAGERSGIDLHLQNIVETTWNNWKALFPDTKVINSNTGFSRNYQRYPYGNYKTCNSLSCGDFIYFPIANDDNSLPAKNRVLVLIRGDEIKAFDIASYAEPQILSIDLGAQKHSIVISGNDNIAVGFETVRDLSIKNWNIANGDLTIMEMGTGNEWDITGQKVGNPDPAQRLKAANGYIAYWFSVAAFYPQVEIIAP